jgi:hypothetical protein
MTHEDALQLIAAVKDVDSTLITAIVFMTIVNCILHFISSHFK